MKALREEKNGYVEASRSKSSFSSTFFIKKAYFHDVEALDLLLLSVFSKVMMACILVLS